MGGDGVLWDIFAESKNFKEIVEAVMKAGAIEGDLVDIVMEC